MRSGAIWFGCGTGYGVSCGDSVWFEWWDCMGCIRCCVDAVDYYFVLSYVMKQYPMKIWCVRKKDL